VRRVRDEDRDEWGMVIFRRRLSTSNADEFYAVNERARTVPRHPSFDLSKAMPHFGEIAFEPAEAGGL
jgi:hypothetical protein